MELDNVNLSTINSFHIEEIRRTDVIDLNKKRKLQAEQLGLPIAKLKCSYGSFPSKSLSTFDENPEEEDLNTNIVKGGDANNGFEYESAKDNNSFADDSDSSMSLHAEYKFQAENIPSCPCDRPPSCSFNLGSSSLKDKYYSLDIAATTEGKEQYPFIGEEHHHAYHVGTLHIAENLDEHLNEYGSQAESPCLGNGHDNIGLFTEKEIEEILNSNEGNPGNPNIYFLSSGRQSVSQETEGGQRRPTIDQEFEQYFSTLML